MLGLGPSLPHCRLSYSAGYLLTWEKLTDWTAAWRVLWMCAGWMAGGFFFRLWFLNPTIDLSGLDDSLLWDIQQHLWPLPTMSASLSISKCNNKMSPGIAQYLSGVGGRQIIPVKSHSFRMRGQVPDPSEGRGLYSGSNSLGSILVFCSLFYFFKEFCALQLLRLST